MSCLRNTTLLPMKRPASRISTVPGVMVDLHKRRPDSDQISAQMNTNTAPAAACRGDGAPEFGRLRLAGAGNAGLDIVGRVELGLRGGGELPGLGEGAAVLGLDGPQPPAVVRVRPGRPLDSLRQLRRRRHWIGAVRGAASARGLGAAAGEEWSRGFGRRIYMCAAAWRWKP